jgi:hypothetical protein
LLVSRLTPALILLPKVLAMTLEILAGTAISLFLVLVPVFHVPIKGSFHAVPTRCLVNSAPPAGRAAGEKNGAERVKCRPVLARQSYKFLLD